MPTTDYILGLFVDRKCMDRVIGIKADQKGSFIKTI